MTEREYEQQRNAILARILRYNNRISSGKTLFPRSLAAAKKDLAKLDRIWEKEKRVLQNTDGRSIPS